MTMLLRTLAALLLLVAGGEPLAAQSSGGVYAYEVDEINPALPKADVNLDTPQALIETFLQAGKAEDWERAAHTLDMSDFSASVQQQQGPELARQLYDIFDRILIVDWTSLSDRPDAVDAHTPSDDPMAGAARRNIRLALVELPDRMVTVRIARLDPSSGEPAWLFSKQTVENIPALYRRYGPTPFERVLPDPLLRTAFWTLTWWEIIALPLVFLIGLAAASGTFVLFRNQAKTREGMLAAIFGGLKLSAALFAFVGTFWLVTSNLFVFSSIVDSILAPLLTLLLVVAIALIVLNLFEAILDVIREREIDDISEPTAEHDRNLMTSLSAARRLFLVLILLVGGAVVVLQSGLSQTLGFSMLASAGVLGLVVAFAARNALSALMASMQIVFSHAARVGDAVLFDDKWCYVEKIGFSYVRLRTWEGRRFLVPVTTFADSSFENWTKKDPSLLKPVQLFLDHRADIGKLREAFEEFVAEDEGVIEKDEACVEVIGHSPVAVEVRFLARAPDPSTGWDMHCRLRERMLEVAAELDTAKEAGRDHAYLPREREVVIGGGAGE